MGRVRKYATNAERQAAYRQRRNPLLLDVPQAQPQIAEELSQRITELQEHISALRLSGVDVAPLTEHRNALFHLMMRCRSGRL